MIDAPIVGIDCPYCAKDHDIPMEEAVRGGILACVACDRDFEMGLGLDDRRVD